MWRVICVSKNGTFAAIAQPNFFASALEELVAAVELEGLFQMFEVHAVVVTHAGSSLWKDTAALLAASLGRPASDCNRSGVNGHEEDLEAVRPAAQLAAGPAHQGQRDPRREHHLLA